MRPDWRSLLFIPANDDRRLEKAHTRGADALILDLEDAVPPAEKAGARAGVGGWIDRLSSLGQDVVVRVNGGWRLAVADLEAVVRPGLKAVIAPKVEHGWQVEVLAELLGEWEVDRGLAPGGIGLVALVETPGALARIAQIAAADRVIGLALGPEDLSLALGAPPGPLTLDLPCRMIALSAASQGLMALGAPISIGEFRDLDAYRRALESARGMGMTGALCIHPRQVELANIVFSPSQADVEAARAVLAAWDVDGGKGVVALNGRMIDRPVVERARRVLAFPPHSPGTT